MPPKWYQTRWFVLLTISPFVLGPFGLPLLWKSPQFSRAAKWWLTLFTFAWVAWLLIFLEHALLRASESLLDQLSPGWR